MSILDKLNNKEIKLSKSHKILLEYIKKNINDVSYKSISEIADESNLSKSTITRFIQTMGFDSFKEFQIEIAKETRYQNNENIINSSITQNDSLIDVAYKLIESSSIILQKNFRNLDIHKINTCVEKILKSRRIYFVGIGYSGNIAMEYSYKFMRIGINCNYFVDSHTMIALSSIMDKDDLVIAISHTGNTREVIKSCKLAAQNNSTVISITSNENSQLSKISNVSINYISDESLFETGSLSTKTVQGFLLDLIYTQVVKSRFKESTDKKIITTHAIKNNT